MENDIKFFRYERYLGIIDDEITVGFQNINCIELNLFKETEKGYWIGYGYFDKLHNRGMWVSKTAKKRYAYPTKKEALINFIKRNEYRHKILNSQLSICKQNIIIANEMINNI